jgi:hypothetical protein
MQELGEEAVVVSQPYWLSDEVRAGMARARGVSIAIHTHVNAAQSVTPLVARAVGAMLEAGVRDVRNQGVLSYWTKNYRTAIEVDDELALSRDYPCYDPIYMLPEAGQAWWRTQRSQPRPDSGEVVSLANATG